MTSKTLIQSARLSFVLTGFMLRVLSCGVKSGVTMKEVTAQDVWKYIRNDSEASAVLVNVWATWCEPCVEEMPMILGLGKHYRSDELEIKLISVDWLDERDMAKSFLDKHGVKGVSFIKNQGDNDFINALWQEWTGAVPFTLIYSTNEEKVISFWEGRKSRDHFMRAVDEALRKNSLGA